jgi:hypothetical protein
MDTIDIELRLLRAAADMAALKNECAMLRAALLEQRVKFSSDYITARRSIIHCRMPGHSAFSFSSALVAETLALIVP